MTYKSFRSEAINLLRPNNKGYVYRGDNETLRWGKKNTDEAPTFEEIDLKARELQAEYNAQAYARSRATEYPSIQDQLDLQYWDKVNSTDKWGEAVKAVKDKYPKG